jgi:hypothetical protein
MVQSNAAKGVTPFEIVGWRAFRDPVSGPTTQAVARRLRCSKAGMDYGDFIQRIIDATVTRYEHS